jgi:hypothetical protein
MYELLIEQFNNAQLPIENFTIYTQIELIKYSIITYGYNNTINQKGWLCLTWKRYVYKTMNVNLSNEYNYGKILYMINTIYNNSDYYNILVNYKINTPYENRFDNKWLNTFINHN